MSEYILRLEEFKGAHHGKRCFILGNGPSLAKMDLAPLKNEITFVLNRIYLHFPSMGFEPTYFICMNELVLEQSMEAINELGMPRFLNWNRRHLFIEDHNIAYLREIYSPHFSHDIAKGVWGGATVTFAALQLAFYMGFQQVFLIGVDHNYDTDGTPHKTITSEGEDESHFTPEYFPKGFRWQLPDLNTSEYAYKLAMKAFEMDGREILDATVGGKLEVFPKVDFYSLL